MLFQDHPEFTPNLSPEQIFRRGSFGGTYFRPITSRIFTKPVKYKDSHLELPSGWFTELPDSWLTSQKYDRKINRYNVKVGTDLEYWENKRWIRKQDPYGWVQWYCRFYLGRRTDDDERQIKRWFGVAGPKGRFKNQLLRRLVEDRKTEDTGVVSPKISQTLQHWGYQITPEDIISFSHRNLD